MIKSIYYWSLCKTMLKGREAYLTTTPGDPMFPDAYDEVHNRWNLSYEEIGRIRNGKEHHAQYTKDINDGDIHIFVIAGYQMSCFLDDMQRRGLMQYKVYESPAFSNRNYPENGRCLTLFLFHYKDFKHEV